MIKNGDGHIGVVVHRRRGFKPSVFCTLCIFEYFVIGGS